MNYCDDDILIIKIKDELRKINIDHFEVVCSIIELISYNEMFLSKESKIKFEIIYLMFKQYKTYPLDLTTNIINNILPAYNAIKYICLLESATLIDLLGEFEFNKRRNYFKSHRIGF